MPKYLLARDAARAIRSMPAGAPPSRLRHWNRPGRRERTTPIVDATASDRSASLLRSSSALHQLFSLQAAWPLSTGQLELLAAAMNRNRSAMRCAARHHARIDRPAGGIRLPLGLRSRPLLFICVSAFLRPGTAAALARWRLALALAQLDRRCSSDPVACPPFLNIIDRRGAMGFMPLFSMLLDL